MFNRKCAEKPRGSRGCLRDVGEGLLSIYRASAGRKLVRPKRAPKDGHTPGGVGGGVGGGWGGGGALARRPYLDKRQSCCRVSAPATAHYTG